MASADTLLKKALNVNGMVVESHRFYDSTMMTMVLSTSG